MIGKTVSRYKILEKLGGGGMGVAHKVQGLKLDRPEDLKLLLSDLTPAPQPTDHHQHGFIVTPFNTLLTHTLLIPQLTGELSLA